MLGRRVSPLPVAGDCSVLPPDNVWNARVDLLPPHPASDAWVSAVGAEGSLAAIPRAASDVHSARDVLWFEVTRPAPLLDVAFDYPLESDPGPYPIPEQATLALGVAGGVRQLLLVDASRCVLYELYDVRAGVRGLSAASGAVYDLRSNDLRPFSRVPEDRSGLPVLPGLLRRDEVEQGEIRHALRFSAPGLSGTFVWPARRASSSGSAFFPPVGQRFRLRGDLDLDGYSARVRVVLAALQRYGMVLAEAGEPWRLSSLPDLQWTEAELSELAAIRGRDFVAVDSTLLRVDEDSGRVRTQLEVEPLSSDGAGPFECAPDARTACVGNGRFQVRIDWIGDDGTATAARTAPTRSADSVLFWFFAPSNWELMVKVVDGCVINGRHWVFFAGTTDRGYAITVLDSRTGERLVYSSPPGEPATAVTDSDAFGDCRP